MTGLTLQRRSKMIVKAHTPLTYAALRWTTRSLSLNPTHAPHHPVPCAAFHPTTLCLTPPFTTPPSACAAFHPTTLRLTPPPTTSPSSAYPSPPTPQGGHRSPPPAGGGEGGGGLPHSAPRTLWRAPAAAAAGGVQAERAHRPPVCLAGLVLVLVWVPQGQSLQEGGETLQ